jgi:hypothetical protein
MTTPAPSLAERKRQLVVDELTEAAPAAGTAPAAFHAVLQRWSATDGAEDPAAPLDRAFEQVGAAL